MIITAHARTLYLKLTDRSISVNNHLFDACAQRAKPPAPYPAKSVVDKFPFIDYDKSIPLRIVSLGAEYSIYLLLH